MYRYHRLFYGIGFVLENTWNRWGKHYFDPLVSKGPRALQFGPLIIYWNQIEEE